MLFFFNGCPCTVHLIIRLVNVFRLSFILSSLIRDTKDTGAKVDSSQRILCKYRAQVPGSEQT